MPPGLKVAVRDGADESSRARRRRPPQGSAGPRAAAAGPVPLRASFRALLRACLLACLGLSPGSLNRTGRNLPCPVRAQHGAVLPKQSDEASVQLHTRYFLANAFLKIPNKIAATCKNQRSEDCSKMSKLLRGDGSSMNGVNGSLVLA